MVTNLTTSIVVIKNIRDPMFHQLNALKQTELKIKFQLHFDLKKSFNILC